MNWLKKIAQRPDPSDIIMGVIENRYDGSVGGGAYQALQNIGLLPEVCQMINEAAGLNSSARPKMQILAEASGCIRAGLWSPENPQNTDQPQPQPDMNVMPPMGEQEQPMDMPSAEIG